METSLQKLHRAAIWRLFLEMLLGCLPTARLDKGLDKNTEKITSNYRGTESIYNLHHLPSHPLNPSSPLSYTGVSVYRYLNSKLIY